MKFVRGGLQMTTIRDCIAPDRNPKVPSIKLPKGSIDTHVHIFESQYPLFEGRGYNPPDSTLDDLKHLHSQLGVSRVVYTQPSPCLLYTSPSPRDLLGSRMPSSA